VVVVGVDGSDTSWDAFWWACGETRRLGGQVLAVFVSPSASAGTGCTLEAATVVAAAVRCQEAAEWAVRLRCRLEGYAPDEDIDIAFVHARGDAATELLRIAADRRAGLIVVGRSTKARHHVAGSLGRRLIGKRDAPVVVVVP
jgi:nucleotide-binding universal stress UspA family protein